MHSLEPPAHFCNLQQRVHKCPKMKEGKEEEEEKKEGKEENEENEEKLYQKSFIRVLSKGFYCFEWEFMIRQGWFI